MTKRTRLTISIIAAIILLACACPATSLPVINDQPATSIPALPTQPEIPTATPQPTNILYSDDFSVESSELETFRGSFWICRDKRWSLYSTLH